MERTFEDVRPLILDDEADICQVIEAAARRAGEIARSTIHAGEFAVLCESWKPTHLVLDLAMRSIDGLSMLRVLALADQPADIIITSGKGTRILEVAKRFTMESGLTITGVLAKPFIPKRLRELLAVSSRFRRKQSPQTSDPTQDGDVPPFSHPFITRDSRLS